MSNRAPAAPPRPTKFGLLGPPTCLSTCECSGSELIVFLTIFSTAFPWFILATASLACEAWTWGSVSTVFIIDGFAATRLRRTVLHELGDDPFSRGKLGSHFAATKQGVKTATHFPGALPRDLHK